MRKTWFPEPGFDLWVGFVNTVVMSEGKPADRLDYRTATGKWALANGIGTRSAFETRWDRTSHDQFRVLRRHRDRLRLILGDTDRSELSVSLQSPANAMLAELPTWRRHKDDRLEVGIAEPSLLVLLPLVGFSAIEFLHHGDAHRVKQCGSESCILYFVDETRPGNRRWCDGARCGNRERVRRHASRVSSRP